MSRDREANLSMLPFQAQEPLTKGIFWGGGGIISEGEFIHSISVASFKVPSALQASPSGFDMSLLKTVLMVSSITMID